MNMALVWSKKCFFFFSDGCPNYFPNSFSGPKDDVAKYAPSKFQVIKKIIRFLMSLKSLYLNID